MPAPTKQPEGTLGHRRQTLGKGQITIADECGVEQATVSRWENGHSIPRDRDTRHRMMAAYGCGTLTELYSLLAATEDFGPASEKRCFLPFARDLSEYLHVTLAPANHTAVTHGFHVTAAA